MGLIVISCFNTFELLGGGTTSSTTLIVGGDFFHSSSYSYGAITLLFLDARIGPVTLNALAD